MALLTRLLPRKNSLTEFHGSIQCYSAYQTRVAGSLRLAPGYVAVADVATTVVYVILIHQGMSLF